MFETQYKKYPAYKDSGIEWIGEIPEHWELKSVKYSAIINKDSLPETTKTNYSFRYVDIGNVNQEGIINQPEELTFSESPSRARRIVKKGDTIISTVRTYLKAIAFIENDENNLIVSTGFAVLTPRKELDPKYLYFLISCEKIIDTIMACSVGVSYPAINSFDLASIPLWYPDSLQEQKAIADFLDRKTSLIDTLIEKKKRQIELLKEQKQAVINQAVTKGLNPDVEMKDSGIEWLGKIPKHWEVKRMKYLCSIKTGDKDTENNEPEGKYPFFVRSQTEERINSYSYDGEAVLTAGDGVGVAKVFHYVNGKFDYHQRVYKFSDFNNISGKFFFFYIRSNLHKEVLKISAKSTVDSLRLPMLQNFVFAIPPKDEQKEIIRYIDDYEAKNESTIKQAENQIQLLQEYRTALISEAVTGKIDVRVDK